MSAGRQLTAGIIGVLGFFLATAIAGQVIFSSQGDTPDVSFRYGLLYVASAGIPAAMRGSYPQVVAVACQLASGVLLYCLARWSARAAWLVLGAGAVLCAIWLAASFPQLAT